MVPRDAVWKETFHPLVQLWEQGNRGCPVSRRVATMLRRCHLSFVSSLRKTRLERISTLPRHGSVYSASSSAPSLAAGRQVVLGFLLPETGWLTPQGGKAESG